MDIKIEKELILNLKTDESNPNKMSKEQIQALSNSIKKYGFIIPIIVNKDNIIIDGHQRKKAAELLNLEEVPIIKLDVDKIDQKLLKQILNKLKGTHDLELDLEEYKAIYEEQGNLDLLKDYVAMEDEEIKEIIENLNKKEYIEEDNEKQNNDLETLKITINFNSELTKKEFLNLINYLCPEGINFEDKINKGVLNWKNRIK